MRERIKHIDIVAGIMILWMIVQHAMQSAWGIDTNFDGGKYTWNPNAWFPFLNFFMPWFFYKSGAFFQKRDAAELWRKDYKKLLRIFIIWSIVGYICYLLLGWYDGSITLKDIIYTPTRRFFFLGFVEINSPLWFLLSLVGIRLVSNIILPKKEDKDFHLKCFFVVVVGSIVAFGDHIANNTYIPRWVANCSSGLVFFTLGYWLHGYEHLKWLIWGGAIGYACSCILGWNSVCMYNNVLLEGYYLLWFPSALCGIVLINNVCRLLCELVSKITPPVFVCWPIRKGRKVCNANLCDALFYPFPDT